MPVERVDVNISLPPDVAAAVAENRAETEQRIDESDREAQARKAAEKKVAEKAAVIKEGVVQRETFTRENDLQQKMQQLLGGQAGAEAQAALGAWSRNGQLQGKLTEAQKNLFREAMAQSPRRGAEAGQALDRLTQQPGFQAAITSAQQMGTLQAGVLENPRAAAGPAAQMIQSRFMQSPRADAQTKSDFLRFGMQQAARGDLDAMQRAGDLLGTLAETGMPRGAQKAAMAMVQRNPADAGATASVDSFAQHPDVRTLPALARGKATELLCRAGGNGEVKEAFERLAGDPRFKGQTAQNKGRFFATIGSGRPGEYRAITDRSLQALQSSSFPTRDAQVSRFLGRVSAQVQRGGSGALDTGAAIRDARRSPMPAAPRLVSTEGLSEDDAARARAQNRAQILHYFNQVQRHYDQSEKKLRCAKYLEDVNALHTLRDPTPLDTSALGPEELAIYNERSRSCARHRAAVMRLHQQRSRELRGKRMPPSRRRAMAAERRALGRQARYFSPGAGRARSSSLGFTQAAAGTAGRTPPPARAGAPPRAGATLTGASGAVLGDVGAQVSAALSQLGSGGPVTPQQASQVARAIAQQVAQQVARQVTAQLLGGGGPVAEAPAAGATPVQAPAGAQRKQTVQTDGWGVQRVFDRDLVGTQAPVRAPPPGAPAAVDEKYTGKTLVKDHDTVRALDDLMSSVESWTDLSKSEQVLLRNLGWTGQAWGSRNSPRARWPVEMMTAYIELAPAKRESVRRLGFSPHDWDQRIQAFTTG